MRNCLPAAGYIDVDEEHGRRLWYYFATSQRSPENDPLVGGQEGFDSMSAPHLMNLFQCPTGAVAEWRPWLQLPGRLCLWCEQLLTCTCATAA